MSTLLGTSGAAMKNAFNALAEPVLTGRSEAHESAIPSFLSIARAHLGMDVAFLSEFTGGERVLRSVASGEAKAPIQAGASDPLDLTYCYQISRGRLPQLIPDTSALVETRALPVTRELPVGSYTGVPVLLSDGTQYGTLCCLSYEPRPDLTERDLALVRMLADLVAVHVEADHPRELTNRNLKQRILDVIDGNLLQSVYQPIYDVTYGGVAGFECLTRFLSAPTQPPNIWFSDAASVGLGVELELCALKEGLKGLTTLEDQGYVSFNLSPEALASGKAGEILSRFGGGQVVVEITEHQTITDYEAVESALVPLRERGIPIAVDDAGAGYSTFQHILRLQPDIIKLDRSLIQDINEDPGRRALAAAFLQFSRETGSRVIAEGVETEKELLSLRGVGVCLVQGFLLGKPVPLEMCVKHQNECPLSLAQ